MGIVFIWAQTYKEAFKVALVYLSGGGEGVGGARLAGIKGVCGNSTGAMGFWYLISARWWSFLGGGGLGAGLFHHLVLRFFL